MLVGLIANPVSWKDTRRLTGLARVIDVEEKANLIARLLVGIGSVNGATVMSVDDPSGLVRRAVSLAGSAAPPVDYLPIEVTGSESDTRIGAAHLAEMGVAALVTVGGDGTVRFACDSWVPDGAFAYLRSRLRGRRTGGGVSPKSSCRVGKLRNGTRHPSRCPRPPPRQVINPTRYHNITITPVWVWEIPNR